MRVPEPGRIEAQPYAERQWNVFYQVPQFKMRIIELPAGGALPDCQMHDHVVFYVLSGEADVVVDDEQSTLGEGQCLVSPPVRFQMASRNGVRILGIRIAETPDE